MAEGPRAVTLLHPGAMGAQVGRAARTGGVPVLWCREGRSAVTAERARRAGLVAVDTLPEALADSAVVLSVCPPAAAEGVAGQVRDAAVAAGFRSVFVEANAISPGRAVRIAAGLAGVGVQVVDGGIVGPPPRRPGTTRLYLSGDARTAGQVAALFQGSLLDVVVLDRPLGAASGLKLAYASYQKARRALAAVAHALAAAHGVGEELLEEARRMAGGALADLPALPGMAARSWRWVPEMEEVADALSAAGLPPDLARAAAQVMRRWAGDRDRSDLGVSEVLDRLSAPTSAQRPDPS